MAKKIEKKESNPYHQEIKRFTKNIELIRQFVNIVKPTVLNKLESIHKHESNNIKLISEKIEKIKNNSETNGKNKKIPKELQLTPKELDILTTGVENMTSAIRIPAHLNETSLISLISNVELFLSKILHIDLQSYPGALLNKKEKQFNYNDLLDLTTINDAKNALIEEAVESLLHQSFDNWIEYFKDKKKLSLLFIDKHNSEVREIFLRRNLLVHNDGVVNSRYLLRLDSKEKSKYKLGDKLKVDSEYLNRALMICETAFILIAAELQSKTDTDLEEEFDLLLDISYNHLTNDRYLATEWICNFIENDKRFDTQCKSLAMINKWIAIKKQNRFSEIAEEIKNADFSAMQLKYQLAKLVLQDKYKEVIQVLPYALKTEEVFIENIKEWPLFDAMKKNKKHNTEINKIIKEYEAPKKKK